MLSMTDQPKPQATNEPSAAPAPVPVAPAEIPKVIENIEKLELDDNYLRHVPENLFVHFKNLKTLKLRNNPLKEPPKDAICASFSSEVASSDENSTKENIWEYLNDDFENEILNDLSEASNTEMNPDEPNLVPMRSYMLKYKKREGLYRPLINSL